jgi:predicted dehydrogenase
MNAANRLRWGILGTGRIAGQFAVGLAGAHRQVLAAVGSRSESSAKQFAVAHQAAEAYDSYEQLIASPGVDAVYISLPNSMHHEWTLRALRAGKHVLCEKPLATNLAQAQEMADVAKRQGKLLYEGFMYRSHPLTRALHKAVSEGKIGKLRVIRTSFLFVPAKIAGNIKFSTELSGGSLMDVGCYCLSYSRLFAGAEPVKLSATAHLHASGVDDYVVGTMAFPGDILASFSCGMTVRADNTAHLHGTDGYIDIPIPWKPPAKDAEFTLVDAAGNRHITRVSLDKDLYGNEAEDFAAALLDGATPAVTLADSLGNQRCLDELRAQIGLPF